MDILWPAINNLLLFGSVFMLIWSVFRIRVKPEMAMNRRIASAMGLGVRNTAFETPGLGTLLGVSLMIAMRFPYFRVSIRRDQDASGNPNGYSVDEYLAICIASGIATAVGFALVLWVLLDAFAIESLLFTPAIGFAVPLLALRSQAQKRQRMISRQLPYSLDLIALTMEAGSTFTEAIDTLVRDDPNQELNQELRLVQSEIDFGTHRSTALQNMSDRVGLDSLRSVVGAINQAEALGTPLSLILKNQSSMIRMLRSVKAEEASANASMRILIPSMLILIACCMVALAPAIMKFIEGQSLR